MKPNEGNPFANQSFADRVKQKIGGKPADRPVNARGITAEFIGMNNAMPICAEACSCCWDKALPEGYENVANYVSRRAKTGHTSIIEHSNLVMLLTLDSGDQANMEYVLELLANTFYLHTKTYFGPDGLTRVLIGGSLRGYSDLYKEATDLGSPALKAISGILYQYSNSAAFEDIIKLGLMDADRFVNVEPDDNTLMNLNATLADNDKIRVVSADDIGILYRRIRTVDPIFAKAITTYDLLPFVTVTVLFKDMSRTGTHQLVRHRNGITQESQRYVDYSKSAFASPAIFKPEKYDKNHKYAIRFGPSSRLNMTLEEIGDAICGIYAMLHDPAIAGQEFALMKEDARAFLPGNVKCRKIYMTFTYKSLLKFLFLREDIHAQAEIRSFATSLGEWFRGATVFNTKEICDNYTLPKTVVDDNVFLYVEAEAPIEEHTMTEEEYIKAAGLDNKSDQEGE